MNSTLIPSKKIKSKFPLQISTLGWMRRNIQEMNQDYSGRGEFGYGEKLRRILEHGRGGHCGWGRPSNTITNSMLLIMMDGQQVEYHPSFNFPRNIFSDMNPEDRDTMNLQRTKYKRNLVHDWHIQELRQKISDADSSNEPQLPTDAPVGNPRILVRF